MALQSSSWDRLPPVSLEAERAALGSCLMDREALNTVIELLQPEDFYDLNHRAAYDVIYDMANKGKPVDPLTFLEELARIGKGDRLGGQPFVAALIDSVPTTANVEYHARIVRDKAIHRRLITAGNTIVQLGYSEDRDVDEALEQAEQAVFEIADKKNTTSFRRVGDVLGVTFRQIEERFQSTGQNVAGYEAVRFPHQSGKMGYWMYQMYSTTG
ncbi:MAG TPA: hypothetical protein DIC53_02290, partial [Synergistaceae bacterium]|nr:hypothetical protein [Synergistaceae bacterium]